MSDEIFTLVEHHAGTVTDATHELLGRARRLGGPVVACLLHHGERGLADGLAADLVISVDEPALSQFIPEAYVTALAALTTAREPRLVVIANTTVGLDVGGALAVRTGRPLVASCTALGFEGSATIATSRLYGGKLYAEVQIDAPAIAICAIDSRDVLHGRPGSVEDAAAPDLSALRTSFVARSEPDRTGVDITAAELLVSVGRGIGGAENVELAQELACVLGAAVACSRPVTDAGWLPKARQVGRSGRTVTPKLYLACGISGAPEHLEGMSGAELVIAVNTDEHAPIFEVAHYGTTIDLFDLLPALTEAIRVAAG